jgi:hypothetical protein
MFVDNLDETIGWCQECVELTMPDARPCSRCGRHRPESAYAKQIPSRSHLGGRPTCRDCENTQRREHRAKNMEHERAIWRASYQRKKARLAAMETTA